MSRHYKQPPGPARPLNVRVLPQPGEAINSWIGRYAHAHHAPRIALLRHIGIGPHERFDVSLNPHAGSALQVATGLSLDEMTLMTMAPYRHRVVEFEPNGRHIANHTLWANVAHTRFCPHCLDEDDGAWQQSWRLTWTFACLRHGCVLSDGCPECGQRITAHPAVRDTVRANFSCWMNAGARRPCNADLRSALADALERDHPLLHAQSQIFARTAEHNTDTEVREFTEDCRALSIAVLREGDYQRLAKTSALDATLLTSLQPLTRVGDVPATAEPSQMDRRGSGAGRQERLGTSPPTDALMTGALAAYATQVLDSLGEDNRSSLLVPVVEYARAFSREGTRSSVIRYMKAASRDLVHEIERSLTSLSPIQQLRHRTPSVHSWPERSIGTVTARARFLPQRFFLDWSVALETKGGHLDDAFRAALSVATLLPGSLNEHIDALERLLGRSGTYRARSSYFPLFDELTNATFTSIINLADHLDADGAPIDYNRRRHLNWDDLLPPKQWRQLVHGPLDGVHIRQYAAARLYLWQVITESLSQEAPAQLLLSESKRAVRVFEFSLALEDRQVLKGVAQDFLRQQGIEGEPLTWSPDHQFLTQVQRNFAERVTPHREAVYAAVRQKQAFDTIAAATGVSRMSFEYFYRQHPMTREQLRPDS